MNPRVLIEQNSVSDKIFNVRENAHFVPLREKRSSITSEFRLKKDGFPREKWHFDGKTWQSDQDFQCRYWQIVSIRKPSKACLP
jgi:hypothetical protein